MGSMVVDNNTVNYRYAKPHLYMIATFIQEDTKSKSLVDVQKCKGGHQQL
jgi:hypothetical protein